MIPPFPVYLFDVDGTLLDSAADIVGAIQEVLAANGRPAAVDFDFLKSYIGRHLAAPFGDIFPDYDSAADRRADSPVPRHLSGARPQD